MKNKNLLRKMKVWSHRQKYLGEHLSQPNFFKKIRELEKQGNALNLQEPLRYQYRINHFMKQRQDMLENLLSGQVA
jgi:hypothetical protein